MLQDTECNCIQTTAAKFWCILDSSATERNWGKLSAGMKTNIMHFKMKFWKTAENTAQILTTQQRNLPWTKRTAYLEEDSTEGCVLGFCGSLGSGSFENLFMKAPHKLLILLRCLSLSFKSFSITSSFRSDLSRTSRCRTSSCAANHLLISLVFLNQCTD